MCIKRIINKVVPKPLKLPYPEEAKDPSITAENFDLPKVLRKCLVDYRVPEEHWGYWEDEIEHIVSKQYGHAASSGLTKRIWVDPPWANSGTIAHERAHIVEFSLTRTQKVEFRSKLDVLRETNKLVQLVYKLKPYMAVHPHSDLYRYLGDMMPEKLKEYYPKLLF